MSSQIDWDEVQRRLRQRMIKIQAMFRDNPSFTVDFGVRSAGFFDRPMALTIRGTFDAVTIAEIGLIVLEHATYCDIKSGAYSPPRDRLYDDDGNVLGG